MLSLQEINDKASTQLKALENFMDRNGYYDPYQCTPLLYTGLKRSIQRELHETIHHLSLKEFMFKGATTGIGSVTGSRYLIAAVLSNKIYSGISARDRGPAIAADIIEEAKGETVNVATAFTRAYKMSEAGNVTPQGMRVNQSAITYEKWMCPLITDYDMMEDSGYALMDLTAQNAGIALAKETNDQILSVLKRIVGNTGFGTKVVTASGNSTTTPTHIADCVCEVAVADSDPVTGIFHPNLLVISPEAWSDAVTITAGHPDIHAPRTPLYDAWYGGGMDVVIVNSEQLGTITGSRLDLAVSIILDRECGIVIARKNWLRIENYSDPQADLTGAVVTVRQACGEIHDAAIGVLTET